MQSSVSLLMVSYNERRPNSSEVWINTQRSSELIQILSDDLIKTPTRGLMRREAWAHGYKHHFSSVTAGSPTSCQARESEQKALWRFLKAFLPISRAMGEHMMMGIWTRSLSREMQRQSGLGSRPHSSVPLSPRAPFALPSDSLSLKPLCLS